MVFRSEYTWGDDGVARGPRGRNPHNGPMSIYEVHLGSWRPGLDYLGLAVELTNYVLGQGFTHVEFLPVVPSIPSVAPGAIR